LTATGDKQKAYNSAYLLNPGQNTKEFKRNKKAVPQSLQYLCQQIESDYTKALWSFIKSNRKDHCGVPVLLQDSTGPLINESQTKANLLND